MYEPLVGSSLLGTRSPENSTMYSPLKHSLMPWFLFRVCDPCQRLQFLGLSRQWYWKFSSMWKSLIFSLISEWMNEFYVSSLASVACFSVHVCGFCCWFKLNLEQSRLGGKCRWFNVCHTSHPRSNISVCCQCALSNIKPKAGVSIYTKLPQQVLAIGRQWPPNTFSESLGDRKAGIFIQ